MAMFYQEKAKSFVSQPFLADSLFHGLRPKSLDLLNHLKQTRHFKAGDYLIKKAEQPCCIYILRIGQAQLCYDSEAGSSLTIRLAEANEILGLTQMLAEISGWIDIRALTACTCDRIERQDFMSFLLDEPDVCFRLLRLLGSNLQKSYREFCDLCHKSG